jgi:hypothetical protein
MLRLDKALAGNKEILVLSNYLLDNPLYCSLTVRH